jgi:ectoine hydroxylase-related dioxygenase (phytanoyl-CoA dioxygenase family)
MPSQATFERYAEQITGQAGDIVLFNSLVVHSAAPNRSDQRRRALTLCLGRPFMNPKWTGSGISRRASSWYEP